MAHYDCSYCGASIYEWDSRSGECTNCTTREYRDLKVKIEVERKKAANEWEEINKEMIERMKQNKRDFVESMVKELTKQLEKIKNNK